MIRKAQGEDEKRFAPEVKADNEKNSCTRGMPAQGGRQLHPSQARTAAIY